MLSVQQWVQGVSKMGLVDHICHLLVVAISKVRGRAVLLSQTLFAYNPKEGTRHATGQSAGFTREIRPSARHSQPTITDIKTGMIPALALQSVLTTIKSHTINTLHHRMEVLLHTALEISSVLIFSITEIKTKTATVA